VGKIVGVGDGADIVLALLRPGVDREIEVALRVHIALESDVSRCCGLPALAGCEVRDALPCHEILARGFVGVCGGTAGTIGPCKSLSRGSVAL
jgi:hypothetical protein